MKKFLHLILLIFTVSVFSQNINGEKPSLEYCNTTTLVLTNLDTIAAKQLAVDMTKLLRVEYKFYKTKISTSQQNYRYYFIPAVLTPEQQKHLKLYGTLKEMIKIDFRSFMIGSNEDLEITGILKLQFKYIEGKFLDVFPIWEKYFLNGTTKEKVLNYKDQYLHCGDYWVSFKKIDNSNLWRIES